MTNLEEKARTLTKEKICRDASTSSAFADVIITGMALIPGVESLLDNSNYGIVSLSTAMAYFFGRSAYKKYKIVRDLDKIVKADGTINDDYKL